MKKEKSVADEVEFNIDMLSDEELDKILEKNNTPIDEKVTTTTKLKKEKIIEDDKKLDLTHLHNNKIKIESIKDIVKKEVIKFTHKQNNSLKLGKIKASAETMLNKAQERLDIMKISKTAQTHNRKRDFIRETKSSTNEPLTEGEKYKIIIYNQNNKQEIENEFSKKRTIYKEINESHNQEKYCNCKHQFAYFQDQILYSTCRKCSQLKEWKNINDWYRYMKEQQKEV